MFFQEEDKDFLYLALEKCDTDLDRYIKESFNTLEDSDDEVEYPGRNFFKLFKAMFLKKVFKKLDHSDKVDILKQVALGVQFLHQNNIGNLFPKYNFSYYKK